MKPQNLLLVAIAMAALPAHFGCSRTEISPFVSNAEMYPMPASADPSGYEFEPPVQIKAGDQFVATEGPGYACPTMADVDGDGKRDLVVGQFNQGNMLFCRNISADGESPKFASADWIMSGGDRAVVPGVW